MRSQRITCVFVKQEGSDSVVFEITSRERDKFGKPIYGTEKTIMSPVVQTSNIFLEEKSISNKPDKIYLVTISADGTIRSFPTSKEWFDILYNMKRTNRDKEEVIELLEKIEVTNPLDRLEV